MKIIILDDEKPVLMIMKEMISAISGVEVVGAFQDTKDANEFLKANNADLAFVDIRMPEEGGMEFARRIRNEKGNIDIVFLTNSKDYAIEAFDVQALDYIVKPISQEKLERALQRASQKHYSHLSHQPEGNLQKISILCFGGLDLKSSDNEMVRFISSKSSELLAYLLTFRGKSVSKWSIMENVFAGMPKLNAESYLNTTIYKMRKALEPLGIRSAIVCTSESYRIELKDVHVDFIDFENRVNAISVVNDQNFQEAIKTEALFTGDLFGDKSYPWSLLEKERLSLMHWNFAQKLCNYFIKTHEFSQALKILKKMESINILNEGVNILKMKIYAAQGDKAALKKQYISYSRILKKELGMTPSKKIQKIYLELDKSIL